MSKNNRIWIAWETQRRSIELSKHFKCKLFIIEHSGIFRYPLSIIKTLYIFQKEKPSLLFVQNPSMVLATIACVYKKLCPIKTIVDRHTTFLLSRKYKKTIRLIIFKILHRFTIRTADLTIVSNKYLADIVKDMHGIPFVLPDKLPDLKASKKKKLQGKFNILMISSFGKDEPIEEVQKAMRRLKDSNILTYVTGNYKKLDTDVYKKNPINIIFTGFLTDNQFQNMIHSVDIIMVLTTSEYCMLCGCYEAVSANKPLITSDKIVLKEYFRGAVFVKNTERSISKGIEETIKNLRIYKNKIKKLNIELNKSWEKQYRELENIIDS